MPIILRKGALLQPILRSYRHFCFLGIILIDHEILRRHLNHPQTHFDLALCGYYTNICSISQAPVPEKFLQKRKLPVTFCHAPYICKMKRISTGLNAPEKGVSPCCTMQPYYKILPPSYVPGGSIVVCEPPGSMNFSITELFL